MRRAARALLTGALWGAAACFMALEGGLAWAWLQGTLYVTRYGADENPYAAEDTELAGLCALALLPLALTALAWAAYRIVIWRKKRARTRSKR